MKRNIEYWGAGFPVRLIGFPAYKDGRWYGPDVPLTRLEFLVARELLERPFLLTGSELSFLRALAGLTRSEAARRLGVTRRTLINWEDRQKDAIGAPALTHLAIRVRFYDWLFPGEHMPSHALRMKATKAKARISIRYSEAELSWDGPNRFDEVGGVIQLSEWQRSRKAVVDTIRAVGPARVSIA